MSVESILVVDDEAFIGSSLMRALGGAGYSVDSVLSGEEALEAVTQKNYSLALVDINMPHMNGVETCRRIKKISPDLIVIIITGGEVICETEIAAAGGWASLFKPFAHGELQEKIKKALSERGQTNGEFMPEKTALSSY
ncbi:MAG: response regulator [Candidatus Omnitrophica bacterium]|nr:response regulator [Candidatus Omnitrophota bacterium]